MGALSRAVGIGGFVAVGIWLGAGPGSAESGAGPPAATSAVATPAGPPPAATPARLSTADAAALKADPDCQPEAVACAWSQCYPLTSKWTSYSGCIAGSCQVKDKACVMDLISDLYDPGRQRSRGAR
ncbi:MAG TPA: hypothetical protein VFE13_01565 [Caulobacteraceae bacterium]|jgi:hypothetical protein|nr:hypothetical protein [Caulobacteraceae bacterium]